MQITRLFWLLVGLQLVCAQNYQQPTQPQATFPLHDPIRRALGLWGRLLNRMAQPYQSTTDEQLHLRNKDDRPVFDVDSLPSLFPLVTTRPHKAGSIIDELRLHQLLPRVHEDQTTPTVATSASTTTTQRRTTTWTTTLSTKTAKTTPKLTTPSLLQDDEQVMTTNSTKSTRRTELKATVRVVDKNKDKTSEKSSSTTRQPSTKLTPSKPTTSRSTTSKTTVLEAATLEATKSSTKANPKTTPSTTTTLRPSTLRPSTLAQSEEADFEGSGEDETAESKSAESSPNEDDENGSPEEDYVLPISTTMSRRPTKSTTTTWTPKTTQLLTPETTSKKPKRISQLDNIPEAEEETAEFQSDERPFSTTTAPEKATSTQSSMAHFYENSMKVEKLMNPVSSIIDGIGPLILPLLGYSRQAIAGGAPAVVAAAARPAAGGVRIFRPQQVRSNSGISSQSNLRPTQERRLQKSYGGPKAGIIKQSSRPPLPDPLPNSIVYGSQQTVDSFASNAFVVPAENQVAYQRLVNAENSQFISDPQQTDTRTALIRQLLARQGIADTSISDSQMAQIAQLAQQLPQGKKEFVGISPAASGLASSGTSAVNEKDPGYQKGRTMVTTFHEDSGLMVQPESSTTTTGGGFGGGRRPSGSFEQAVSSFDDNPLVFI